MFQLLCILTTNEFVSLMRIIRNAFLACCAAAASVAPAAEVWAPGVSRSGGWYDNNKSEANQAYGTVMGMCWAASASNVISWWYYHNSDSITSTVPEDPWLVYQMTYADVGGYPSTAYDWWINGITPTWVDGYLDENTNQWVPGYYKYPDYIDLTYEEKKKGDGGVVSSWYEGGFLKADYSTKENPIMVQNGNTGSYAFAKVMVDALAGGYALTLSTSGSANHAWTLWGVNYSETENGVVIGGVWITDSDDAKDALVYYEVVCKETAISMVDNQNQSFEINTLAGMRTTRVVPESATATLGLLALAGLAARRRRK